jgi:hypothetical protein
LDQNRAVVKLAESLHDPLQGWAMARLPEGAAGLGELPQQAQLPDSFADPVEAPGRRAIESRRCA